MARSPLYKLQFSCPTCGCSWASHAPLQERQSCPGCGHPELLGLIAKVEHPADLFGPVHAVGCLVERAENHLPDLCNCDPASFDQQHFPYTDDCDVQAVSRRIAACWNAFVGYSTEEVEARGRELAAIRNQPVAGYLSLNNDLFVTASRKQAKHWLRSGIRVAKLVRGEELTLKSK